MEQGDSEANAATLSSKTSAQNTAKRLHMAEPALPAPDAKRQKASPSAPSLAPKSKRGGKQRGGQDKASSERALATLPTLKVHQSVPDLNLLEALRLATGWHPKIAQAGDNLRQQMEQVNVARSGYYPKISAGLKSDLNGERNNAAGGQAAVISATQMLYDFGKVSSSVAIARAGVAERTAQAAAAFDDVAKQTADAFLDTQRYQELIEIALAQVSSLEELSGLAKLRFEKGASTRSDYEQTVSRVEAARVTQWQYNAQLERSRSILASLLGGSPAMRVSEEFPAELAQACDNASSVELENTPEVQAALARRDEAEAAIRKARADGRPTLSLEPSMSYRVGGGREQGPAQDKTQYGVFLNFSMPLYQGGGLAANRRASESARDAADAGVDMARLNVKQSLEQTQNQLAGLQMSLTSLAMREQAIVSTRGLYKQQYLELGTRTLLDLLNSEQEIFQSRVENQNTQSNIRSLSVGCAYTAGKLGDVIRGAGSRIGMQGYKK